MDDDRGEDDNGWCDIVDAFCEKDMESVVHHKGEEMSSEKNDLWFSYGAAYTCNWDITKHCVLVNFCIFTSCNFTSCNLVRHFHILHFHPLKLCWCTIFTSCVFNEPFGGKGKKADAKPWFNLASWGEISQHGTWRKDILVHPFCAGAVKSDQTCHKQ